MRKESGTRVENVYIESYNNVLAVETNSVQKIDPVVLLACLSWRWVWTRIAALGSSSHLFGTPVLLDFVFDADRQNFVFSFCWRQGTTMVCCIDG